MGHPASGGVRSFSEPMPQKRDMGHPALGGLAARRKTVSLRSMPTHRVRQRRDEWGTRSLCCGLEVGQDGGLRVFLREGLPDSLVVGGKNAGMPEGIGPPGGGSEGLGGGRLGTELIEKHAADGFVDRWRGELGGWRDGAVSGVGDDGGDGLGDLVAFVERVRAGVRRQVEGGDLQAVKEQAGAAGIERVGGDVAEDLADGCLNGAAVFGEGQVEGGLGGVLARCTGARAARGVVVVAEVLVGLLGLTAVGRFEQQRGAAATVAVGEDVAALEAFFGVHGGLLPPPGVKS
jgi:hypothetical protein